LDGGPSVDLGELVVGAGKADLESFDLTEPAFAFFFCDAGLQVVADLDDAIALGGIGPMHRAAKGHDATHLHTLGQVRRVWIDREINERCLQRWEQKKSSSAANAIAQMGSRRMIGSAGNAPRSISWSINSLSTRRGNRKWARTR
jgi:hypothetical protein